MGEGYIIGCNNCIKEDNLKDIWNNNSDINGTFFNIHIGGLMLCFCKEQLEKRYGINRDYKREYRLLAAGDPPDEIYKTLGSATDDKDIDKIIYENIKNGFEFTEKLGDFAYYCKNCKKLFNRFYFQMVKENQIYTPTYICRECKNNLEIASFGLDKDFKNDELYLEDDEIDDESPAIDFKYRIYLDNNIVKIKNNKDEEEKIICNYCKNSNFSIMSHYFAD